MTYGSGHAMDSFLSQRHRPIAERPRYRASAELFTSRRLSSFIGVAIGPIPLVIIGYADRYPPAMNASTPCNRDLGVKTLEPGKCPAKSRFGGRKRVHEKTARLVRSGRSRFTIALLLGCWSQRNGEAITEVENVAAIGALGGINVEWPTILFLLG